MRLMIDFTSIPVLRAGAGVYAEKLVREMPGLLAPSDLLFVLVQADEKSLLHLLQDNKRVRFVAIPSRFFRNRAALFLFEQLVLPLMLLAYRIDLVHSLHYTHPLLSPCPTIVTIHDLTHVLFPKLHTLGRRLIMPFFLRRAMRHADAVIFVSDSTRKDAERMISGSRALGFVVPLGVDSTYSFSADPEEISFVLDKLELRRPFILNIGTIEPRKNLVRLIEAFEKVADCRPDVRLVVAGKLGWNYSQTLERIKGSRHASLIRLVGFITEDEKRILLTSCELFIYPSLYEGFGLPILEAMSAGVPVITSDISSMAEVAGDAALLVNPESIDQLSAAIQSILSDPLLSATYRAQGRKRAQNYSWGNTACGTYKVYRLVANKR